MLVTIYTDASYKHKTKKAVGAFYIKYKNKKYTKNFKLENIQNSNEAELLTVIYSLRFVLRNFKDATIYYVRTDNNYTKFVMWYVGGFKKEKPNLAILITKPNGRKKYSSCR